MQKTIVILSHAYELCRQRPSADNLHVRAFVGQSLKAAFDASNTKGSWAMVWPLLCLSDPDDLTTSLTSPTERVALAVYQKERLILEKAAATASGKKE